SPVKLCSVSQIPSKPAVSAKHAWVTASSMAAASSSGVGDSPSVSQPNCIGPLGSSRAGSARLGQYGGLAGPDQGGTLAAREGHEDHGGRGVSRRLGRRAEPERLGADP